MILSLIEHLILLVIPLWSLFVVGGLPGASQRRGAESEIYTKQDLFRSDPDLSGELLGIFGRAVKFHQQALYREAKELYLQLLKEIPDNQILRHNLSRIPAGEDDVTMICPHCGQPLRVKIGEKTSSVRIVVKCSACSSVFEVTIVPDGGVNVYRR